MSIKKGDKCPAFSLQNQHGETIAINDLIGSKNLVIYFYPKDKTSGCTRQACSFRDSYQVFSDLDCEIIGISSDSVRSHQEFSESYQLKFNLLADVGDQVRNLFGVPESFFGLIKGRVTYIVDKKGIVQYVFRSQVNGTRHVKNAVKFLKDMK